MKREIKCRLFVHTESGLAEYAEIPLQEQHKFSDECVKRIGENLNAESMYELFRAASAVPQ